MADPSYEDALTELYGLSGRGIRPGLERIRDTLRRLADPQASLRVVHVAGTNGKGSVCGMVAEGIDGRTGLFTSPHLHSLCERFRVNGEPVEPEAVAQAWGRLRSVLGEPGAPALTFFEAVTVIAFDLFATLEVEVAVLETGLGGRLDSTNVIERPLACAITPIGLDHQAWLGPDLASIAREKAGILRSGVPAVMAPQRPEAAAVIEAEARRIGAPLHHVDLHFVDLDRDGRDGVDLDGADRDGVDLDRADRDGVDLDDLDLEPVSAEAERVEGGWTIRVPTRAGVARARPRLAGAHQLQNAAVAAAVLRQLERAGLGVDPVRAIEQVRWPGRLEWIGEHPPFLLDAAHNPDGARALARHLAAEVPRRPRVLIFGAMRDKDWAAMLDALEPEVDERVFVAPGLSRAERPRVMARQRAGLVATSVNGAIAEASRRAGAEGVVVTAGSIFVMAEVRAALLGLRPDPVIAM